MLSSLKTQVTWQGGESSLGRLSQRFPLLPPSLRQQPELLITHFLLSQKNQGVGQAALC